MLMPNKKNLLCAGLSLALLLGAPLLASAHQKHHRHNHHYSHTTKSSDVNKVADLVLARPVLLGATVLGTGAYLVTYPFTSSNGTSGAAKRDWVDKPARATFDRPLGAPIR